MQCPKCSGAMWDNRNDKRNPRSPDYKCKNKSCGEGVWEDKQNGNGANKSNGAPGNPAAARPVGAALAPLYADCMAVASQSVKHYIGDKASGADIVAATATLFIQAAQTGRPVRRPAPPPPPPPPPPRETEPMYDDPYMDDRSLPF